MRQPTFLAQAWPRLDHQVYCSGSWFTTRKASTKPTSPNSLSIHALSSGRKPEFFWLERQFLRSISLWAMFQSPQMRSEEHTSELQSRENLVCRLLLEKKK